MSEIEYNKGCQVYEWDVKQRFAQEVRIVPATVGIFLHGQQGDIMSAMSVLKYRQEIWRDAKIVWYADEDNFDLFKYQDIELRKFPRGFGYPEMVVEENKKLVDAGKDPIWEDWKPLVDKDNKMNLELKSSYPSLSDISFGYFPAPHQMTPLQRHGYDYPRCSQKVFEMPFELEWHPYLLFSGEERQAAKEAMVKIGSGKKVLIETFAGSGQSRLDEEMIIRSMAICKEQWGEDCNFIFASHKFLKAKEAFREGWFEQPNVYSCSHYTVRQCALIADLSDLMISVSSGITVAASAWGIRQPPTLQFTGSFVCSTKSLSHCQFELVTADDKKINDAKTQYYLKLITLLNQNK